MKKTINLTTWLLAFGLLGAITFTACKKDDSMSPVTDNSPAELVATQEATTDEAETEAQFDDVFNFH